MIKQLKPCPFCGSEDVHIETNENFSFVECYECGAISEDFLLDASFNPLQREDGARTLWNTRPLEDALLARAEKAEARIVELQDALDTSAQVTAKQIAKSAADLQRAEKAEAIINGMFPMWIAAMSYCEHGRAADLDRMRNYYNGRDNPLTSDELHALFEIQKPIQKPEEGEE